MRSRITLTIALAVLMLLLPACTIGMTRPPGDPVKAAGTIVAATLRAQGITTSVPASQAAGASTPPAGPTFTATAKPQVKIGAGGAACRTGPSTNEEILTTLGANSTADMIAKNTSDGYWLVKDPVSGSSCWVRMQEATASGDYTLLPEVTPQATEAQPSTPAKPGSSANFNYWEYNCGAGSVSLQWLDNADDESGYRVYRNGAVIADLGAGSTSYTDAIYIGIGALQYSIRAYNNAGESAPLNTPGFSC